MKAAISSGGGVLVITLHQPGSEVSSLMDDLLLLAYGGRPVFFGPWGGAMAYFTAHLGLKLPPHTGLADWLLALLDREAARKQQQQRMIQVTSRSSSSGSGSGGGGCEVVMAATDTTTTTTTSRRHHKHAATNATAQVSQQGGSRSRCRVQAPPPHQHPAAEA
jgi:hypothetical protein